MLLSDIPPIYFTYLSIRKPITALPNTPPTSNTVDNIPDTAGVYFNCK